MLEIRDLTSHYGRVQALHGVSLAVRPCETVALVGANGAGKTTLLNVISGLQRATAGVVLFEGEDITAVLARFSNWRTIQPTRCSWAAALLRPAGRRASRRSEPDPAATVEHAVNE